LSPNYTIQSKILFREIARFGASPTFFWANAVDPTKKSSVAGAPALALVTLFTCVGMILFVDVGGDARAD